jgi:signal transduction histidine kinase
VRERTALLERSNRDLEEYAYAASHDLAAPLRKSASFLDLVAEELTGKLTPDGERHLERSRASLSYLRDMLRELLTYARAERGPLARRSVLAQDCLEQALSNLEPELKAAGATVDSGPLPAVRADPAALTRLFQNMVGNSLKFRADAPPKVEVSAERADDGWAFTVKDNGLGIPAEHRGRVFSLFMRLADARGRPGTGIGLALCRRIVERHGGRIWVEPSELPGAVLRFTLPDAASGGDPEEALPGPDGP